MLSSVLSSIETMLCLLQNSKLAMIWVYCGSNELVCKQVRVRGIKTEYCRRFEYFALKVVKISNFQPFTLL